MRYRIAAMLPVVLAAAGCMSPGQVVIQNPMLVARVANDAASQIRRCYRPPRIAPEGRRIVTRVGVQYTPKGALAAPPQLLWQSGVTRDNEVHALRLAQAAQAAIVSCAPVVLPPELYANGWDRLMITFALGVRA